MSKFYQTRVELLLNVKQLTSEVNRVWKEHRDDIELTEFKQDCVVDEIWCELLKLADNNILLTDEQITSLVTTVVLRTNL